jgi:hypothetical protein
MLRYAVLSVYRAESRFAIFYAVPLARNPRHATALPQNALDNLTGRLNHRGNALAVRVLAQRRARCHVHGHAVQARVHGSADVAHVAARVGHNLGPQAETRNGAAVLGRLRRVLEGRSLGEGGEAVVYGADSIHCMKRVFEQHFADPCKPLSKGGWQKRALKA